MGREASSSRSIGFIAVPFLAAAALLAGDRGAPVLESARLCRQGSDLLKKEEFEKAFIAKL